MLFKKNYYFSFVMIYIYFIIMSFLIIPVGDDYFWWGNNGIYLLKHNFYGNNPVFGGSCNGRYLGNIFEILIMHSSLFATIVYASTVTLFIWCIWNLTGKGKVSLELSLAFLTIFQMEYIRSIFLWFSGFANYLPPITLLLFYFVLIKNHIKEKSMLPIPIYFLISLAGGLFVEHMTIYQIFIGFFSILLIHTINKLKLYNLSLKPMYAYLLGSLMSAIIMFSNPSYHHNNSSYHKVAFSFVKSIHNFNFITHFWILTFNWQIILLISISILIISWKNISNKKIKLFLISSSLLFISYYSIVNIYIKYNYKINEYTNQIINVNKIFAYFDTVFGVLFFLFILISTFIIFNNIKFLDIYFYLFCFIALIVPFFFILSPIFIREYFSSFVFLFIVSILYFRKAIDTLSNESSKILEKAILILIFITYSLTMFMMMANYHSNIQRVNDNSFLSESRLLKYKVPYNNYVFLNDTLNMQSSEYWNNKLSFKTSDYIFNSYYK